MRRHKKNISIVKGGKRCSNKLCSVPVEEQVFGIRLKGIRKGNLRSQCLTCENRASKKYNKKNPERRVKLRRNYTSRQTAKHNAEYYANLDLTGEKLCIGLFCKTPKKTFSDFYRNKGSSDGFSGVCIECKVQREVYLKQTFVDGYGGKCTCCGEAEIRFLTLEHKNRDGKLHRKRTGGTSGMWLDIIKNNFPPQYTVLCFNCNCSEGQGVPCPHKLKKGITDE